MLKSVRCSGLRSLLFRVALAERARRRDEHRLVRAEQQQRREIHRVRHRHRRAAGRERQRDLERAPTPKTGTSSAEKQRLIEARERQAARRAAPRRRR